MPQWWCDFWPGQLNDTSKCAKCLHWLMCSSQHKVNFYCGLFGWSRRQSHLKCCESVEQQKAGCYGMVGVMVMWGRRPSLFSGEGAQYECRGRFLPCLEKSSSFSFYACQSDFMIIKFINLKGWKLQDLFLGYDKNAKIWYNGFVTLVRRI